MENNIIVAKIYVRKFNFFKFILHSVKKAPHGKFVSVVKWGKKKMKEVLND